jgi:8-amino-7-oxononanoate synthase
MEVVGWGMEAGLYSYQRRLDAVSNAQASVEGQAFLMMSSYDYLGLLGHPDLEQAAIAAIQRFGTGSGGVRLLTGTNELHVALEEELARFKQVEAAITFTSGYVANLAAVTALLGPRDGAILDARAHRSLVDACRTARVPFRFFAHNDPRSLEQVLREWQVSGRRLVVAEGVYSMDGDICPLPALVDLKKRHDAYLMIDEAHALGVLGSEGRGVHDHYGLESAAVDLWMGTLSKAIPATGGYLAGSRALITYLQHEAAPFMFSAAVSPPDAAAALAALHVLQAEPWRRRTVNDRAEQLRHGLRERGFDAGDSCSPIVPVVLGGEERAWEVARDLEEEGILACAVVPPAVPRGGSRLRLCAMASHSAEDIDRCLAALGRGAAQARAAGE